jgi:hypothetical protein
LEVCRARGDDAGANRYTAVLEAIYAQFPVGPGLRRNEALVRPRIEVMAGYLSDVDAITPQAQVYGQIDGYERVLSRFLDEGGRVDPQAWQTVVDACVHKGYRIMAAQSLRAVGLAVSSADQLDAALELAARVAAAPLAARLRIELGGLRGDAALTEDGIAALRELGDLEHLGRVGAQR